MLKTRKQAVAAAIAGDIAPALAKLLELHAAGDAAASASAAEILAFQGRYDEMLACAKALLANKGAVYAGNVVDDMTALVALAKRKSLPKLPRPPKPDTAALAEALEHAKTMKRLVGKPLQMAQHCFALAVVYHVDAEIIRRWDPEHPLMHFDNAVEVARAHVRANKPAAAWKVLEGKLASWFPVDAAQVLPVVLLTDPHLLPLMTTARKQLVLRTPRALND